MFILQISLHLYYTSIHINEQRKNENRPPISFASSKRVGSAGTTQRYDTQTNASISIFITLCLLSNYCKCGSLGLCIQLLIQTASISIQSATPFPRACYFRLSLKGPSKGPSKDGPFSPPPPPPRSHLRNQGGTGAKPRCGPWYQPWGGGGDGGPFLK